MHLARIGPRGQERPVQLDEHGLYRDLSSLIPDLRGEHVTDTALAQIILSSEIESLPVLHAAARLGPCVQAGRTFQIGVNTSARAAELRLANPRSPVILDAVTVTTLGVDDDLPLDDVGRCFVGDVGIELGVIVGATADSVSIERARFCVAGYCAVVAFSHRNYVSDPQGHVIVGTCDFSYLFVGPRFVTWDESTTVLATELQLSLNGKLIQELPISYLRFDPPTLIHHLSQRTTLNPGDLICAGRPELTNGRPQLAQRLRRGDTFTANSGPLGTATVNVL